MALANFMRLSLQKGAYAVLYGAAWQEIRVRSGRDDNSIGATSSRYPNKLSSRPERSAVEGPAVSLTRTLNPEELLTDPFRPNACDGRSPPVANFQVDMQQRDRSRRHPGNPARLPQRLRPHPGQ